jgi:Na+/H+ antiporter NhaD/arsenite permease-like protein
MADVVLERMPDVKWVIVSLALFAGIISAFVDNVATVLMVAPIAITVAKRLKISPFRSSSQLPFLQTFKGRRLSSGYHGDYDGQSSRYGFY